MALADLVLLNGRVLTMNPRQPHANAVAVKDGRIAYVGTNKEANKLCGKTTRVIRLRGKTVVPGFIDTHIHVADFGRILNWINLEDAKSIKDMQVYLRERIKEEPEEKWILGKGWDHKYFHEKRLPTRFDLDAVSPDNPVVFYHHSGKMCVANSKALELAGILKRVTVVPLGEVDRSGESAEPTGILQNDVMNVLWRVVPEPSEEELLEAAGSACRKIVEAGVTSIHWIVSSRAEVSIIRKLHAQHRLNLRVYVIIPANLLDASLSSDLLCGFADEELKFGGALIFADGYLAARTAALFQPYSDGSASDKGLLYTPEELNMLVANVQKLNFQLVIHAVGDKAVDAALTAIETNSTKASVMRLRNRLEQAAVLNEESMKRMKNQRVLVSVQPKVVASEFSLWSAIDRLGVERARWLFPLKTLLKTGICVVGGSDCPMEPLNPMSGIQAAVTRGFFPEEQVTVAEALHMYTVNAAYASFEEKLKGSIEAGKLADFAVLSADPQAVEPNKIEDIAVDMTVVGGRIVYQRLSP